MTVPAPGDVPFDAHALREAEETLRHIEELRTKPNFKAITGTVYDDLQKGDAAHKKNGMHRKGDEWDDIIPLEASTDKLPPFPVDVLPPWIARFVRELAAFTSTPHDLAGVIALSGLATALAKKFCVAPRPGWTEPVNLYALVAADPGERKSPVFAAITAPIEAHERELTTVAKPAFESALARRRVAESTLKYQESIAAKANAADKEDALKRVDELAHELAATETPLLPRVIAEDSTPEALTRLLAAHGRIAILSSEGGIFDLISGRYEERGKPPNLDVFLKAWGGEQIRVDRMGRESEYAESPALTIGVTVQREVVRGLATKPTFRGRGLLGRFLYSMPPSLLGTRDSLATPLVSAEAFEAFNAGMSSLLRMEYARDAAGRRSPNILDMPKESFDLVHTFDRSLEPRLKTDLSHMTDWCAKLVGTTLRIAGLLHVAEGFGREEGYPAIQPETVQKALLLAAYFVDHAKAAYNEFGANPLLSVAQKVFAWIKERGEPQVKRRDVFRRWSRGMFKAPEDADLALEFLVGHGVLRPMTAEPGPGRRAVGLFAVHPALR